MSKASRARKTELSSESGQAMVEDNSSDGKAPNVIDVKSESHEVTGNSGRTIWLSESKNQTILALIMRTALSAIPLSHQNDKDRRDEAYSMVIAIDPQDAIEGFLASQMTANQVLIKEFVGRILYDDQTIEGVERGVNRMNKLMSLFCRQVDTLKRYREGGKQIIQVQHVHVNEGGQAVVGNVKTGGADG